MFRTSFTGLWAALLLAAPLAGQAQTGNVGIGTTTPTRKLEVAGQVFSSSGGFQFPDNTVQTTAATTASNGLTRTGDDIALSGTLTQATTVATGGFNLGLTGTLGVGTSAPAAPAALDVTSTTKGFLPPRLSPAQRDAIASPAAGLTIFNTATNKLNTWNGTSWDASISTAELPLAGAPVTFNYTAGPQTYTVPASVTALTIDAAGAVGGTSASSNLGGRGARVQATLTVVPGEVLTLYVGGTGAVVGGATTVGGAANTASGAAVAGPATCAARPRPPVRPWPSACWWRLEGAATVLPSPTASAATAGLPTEAMALVLMGARALRKRWEAALAAL